MNTSMYKLAREQLSLVRSGRKYARKPAQRTLSRLGDTEYMVPQGLARTYAELLAWCERNYVRACENESVVSDNALAWYELAQELRVCDMTAGALAGIHVRAFARANGCGCRAAWNGIRKLSGGDWKDRNPLCERTRKALMGVL